MSTRMIDVSDLPDPLVEAMETMVRTYRQRSSSALPEAPRQRALGWGKGLMPDLPESFFEPLPDELVRLIEGREE